MAKLASIQPILLWCVIAAIVIGLLYFDASIRQSRNVSIREARTKWPVWDLLEPPDRRIRILWINQDYVPFVNAGSEICTHQLNTYLMKKPYKFDVFVASPAYPRQTYENVRCFDLNNTELFHQVLNSCHIIMSHSGPYRQQLIWLSHVTGKPFVSWIHTDNYVNGVHGEWNDPRILGRQWTVFNSKSLRSLRSDIPDEYLTIMNPTVDYHTYGVDKDTHIRKYITLSNVNDNKGGNILIKLAKALPEYEFLGIMGGYRKQIVEDGIPNLRYITHTTEIKDIYAQTAILIMPSKEETWGRSAVEAMSSGIPVVVSPTPGLRECCQDAAIYCDRGDLGAWIATIRRLKTDTEFYKTMSARALDRARALDPRSSLETMEHWIEEKVFPSAKPGRTLTALEKNMLFR
jgi:glycosyltransferase involved in cell wall biosynthesis